MRLIITELKFENPWERTRKGIVTNFALCLSLTTTVLIFTIISYTWLIAMLMGGIISLIYYVLFVREIRRVQAALAQYSRERLVQFGENRKELVQLRRFKILSNTLCLGVTFFVFSLIYEKINIITSLILYYGQCYAYLTYHIQYTPILQSLPQQLTLFQIIFYISRIKMVLQVITIIIIGVPFILATLVCFIFKIYYYYIRKVQTRFHVEDLKDSLLESK